MKRFFLLFVLFSIFIYGCAIQTKHGKFDGYPVKKITVTINKTTPQDVMIAWGAPTSTSSFIHKNYAEIELEYFYKDKGCLFEVTVCNERNQCGTNGKRSTVQFKFRDNKFVHVWQHIEPE